jgi:predicted 3-demethylubiquinone-9 3-methyltransferase (glyoxalase superfamily)/uncharacterized protein YndB with AHSA1/START domain
MKTMQPYLWFDDQAEAAAEFYVRSIPDSRIDSVSRYHESGSEVSGMPAESVMSVSFELGGLSFVALNGGPLYSFSPAVSFFVNCATAEEVDRVWNALSEGGEVMMALGAYAFSARYGWVTDRFGVGWQVMLSPSAQRVVPSLLFTRDAYGKGQAAIDTYTWLIPDSRVVHEELQPDGTVLHATLELNGTSFTVMENNQGHEFGFTPAISFLLACDSQEELDRVYGGLADGGETMPCGWLTDRFGVTWQVVPAAMFDLLQDDDPVKAERAMKAMLSMTRIDLAAIERAFRGEMPKLERTTVMVSTIVRVPLAKAWDVWTDPKHIVHWNAASDDWHAPHAENDLRQGGRFSYRMEAKDGSFGFDFGGVYDEVEARRCILYTLGDGRHVSVTFDGDGGATLVRETFDAEAQNPPEAQRKGWQAILDRYRDYAQGLG